MMRSRKRGADRSATARQRVDRRSWAALASALLSGLLVLAGCGGPAATAPATPAGQPTSAAPTVPPTDPPTSPSSAPTPSPFPRPSGVLAWPLGDPVELAPGRYMSSPPFDLPFTLEIADPGWETGHLHGEYFDLFRFDAGPTPADPTRSIAFALPEHVRGADGNVSVTGLTPDAALDHLLGRASLQTGNRAPAALFGLDGARLDLHSTVGNNPVFGGPAGDFGLWPSLDVRLVALARPDGLLFVLVFAPAGALEAAWTDARKILETVVLLAA